MLLIMIVNISKVFSVVQPCHRGIGRSRLVCDMPGTSQKTAAVAYFVAKDTAGVCG